MSSNNGSKEDGLENVITGSSSSCKGKERKGVKESPLAKDESRIEEVIEKGKEEKNKREEESHKSRAIPVLKTKKPGRKVSSEKSSSKILGEDEKGGSDGSLANDKNCNGGGKRGGRRRRGDDDEVAHDNFGDEVKEAEDEVVECGKRRSTRVGIMMRGNNNSIERSSEPSIGHSQETVGLRERKKRDDGEEGETNDESDFMQNRISSNHHHDDSDEEQDNDEDDVRNDSLATRNNGRKFRSPFAIQVTRSDSHSSSRSLTRRLENSEQGREDSEEQDQDYEEEEEEEGDDDEDGLLTSPDGNNNLNGLSTSANLMHQLSKKFKVSFNNFLNFSHLSCHLPKSGGRFGKVDMSSLFTENGLATYVHSSYSTAQPDRSLSHL